MDTTPKETILPSPQPQWQTELSDVVENLAELCQLLRLDPADAPWPLDFDNSFPLRLPRSLVQRMPKSDWYSPLLLQYLPLLAEQNLVPEFSTDPVGDTSANLFSGVLHKYHGRILLLLTGRCAVHCRYCFRRHFAYNESPLDSKAIQVALRYVEENPQIKEIIFSGGDPLLVKDGHLKKIINQLNALPHVRRIRIHTRLPVVLPSRITQTLVETLQFSRAKIVIVIHSNHASELDTPVNQALQQLHRSGFQLFNQAVLLKNINDQVKDQVQLSETLFENSVLPYYLHRLDRVQGAAHFALEEREIDALYQQLQAVLPGYLVPKLVTEVAGEPHKILWQDTHFKVVT